MAKQPKPKPQPYETPTKWALPIQHTIEVEFDNTTIPVRVQELSLGELLRATEAGEEAATDLFKAAILNPDEIPARYAPLVMQAVADFFTRPMQRSEQDGATESDDPEDGPLSG